ncbi:MAG: SDR family oxidoreductase [Alphaproteobacteria bacterium]|nr:SDR family oxidoreductase [Alphaproteobacteria bacterium]
MARSPGVALVTGAAVRIGRAIALGLAADGWTVAVHHHRSTRDARAVVDRILRGGGRSRAFAADLSRESAVEALIPRVARALGPVSLLVNNASVFGYDDVATADRRSWDRHLAVNLRAPFVLAQRFAAQLPPRAAGHIVNLLDQRVWRLTPSFMSYTVSKAGLWTLTQTLAMALAPRIRVNAIGPGPTLPSARQSAADFRRQVAATPLGRGATPEEIYDAVRFILAAPAMTGQMIALDGGQHLPGRVRRAEKE